MPIIYRVVCLLGYFSVLFNTHFVYSAASETKCSSSNNERWSKFKNECVTCPDCPPGKFRNLTEPVFACLRKPGLNIDHRSAAQTCAGPYGDEQCLQCRQCPEGKYSNKPGGECIKCRMNCTEMNREYDETCSRIQDAKCGSCLFGFEDTYGHILFPCSPKKSLRLLEPSKGKSNQRLNLPDKRAKENTQAATVNANTGKEPGGTIAIVTGSIGVLIMAAAVTVILKRKRNLVRQGHHDGIYGQVNNLSVDTDVETDAWHEEDTVPKVEYQRIDNDVRPELTAAQEPLVRPGLSQSVLTEQLDGLTRNLRLSDGSLVSVELTKDFCRCRVKKQCACTSYKFPAQTLHQSHEYIIIVASEVCHDPFQLFRKLGLNNPILYQENDTRDRDPENITQKELIIRLLNIWIEMKSSQATLDQLSKALCASDFHEINKKLYDIYCKSLMKRIST